MILNPKTAKAAVNYYRALNECSRSPRPTPIENFLVEPLPGTVVSPIFIPIAVAMCAYTVAYFAKVYGMTQLAIAFGVVSLLAICSYFPVVLARAVETAIGIPAWLRNAPERAKRTNTAREHLVAEWPKDRAVLRTDLMILQFRQKIYHAPTAALPVMLVYLAKVHDILPPTTTIETLLTFARSHPLITEEFALLYSFIAIAGAMVAARDREIIYQLKAKLKIQ